MWLFKGTRTTIKPQIFSSISIDEGMLVIRVKGEIWEVRHASFLCCNLMEKRSFSTIDFPLWTFQHTLICKEWYFCNPNCLPIYLPSIFCFFLEGALGLADPSLPFLFFGFFLLIFYLLLPLLLPRSQIKQLGTLLLYLSYLPAKIKQFGQTSFSILQLKIQNMAWSRLGCWTIHQNLSPHQAISTDYILLEICDLCMIKAEHIWNFSLSIMKYETYWYR